MFAIFSENLVHALKLNFLEFGNRLDIAIGLLVMIFTTVITSTSPCYRSVGTIMRKLRKMDEDISQLVKIVI